MFLTLTLLSITYIIALIAVLTIQQEKMLIIILLTIINFFILFFIFKQDLPRKPSPADKGKRYPITDKPKKKKKVNPEDYDDDGK